MNVELKRIAEKKIEQLGGDVCGVLVRKDGKLAAVDEHGRVQWLQSGQGAEPVVDIGTQEREGFWQQPIDKYTKPAQQECDRGLPDVGTICEYQLKHDEPHDEWSRCVIEFVGDRHIVAKCWPDEAMPELEQCFTKQEVKFLPLKPHPQPAQQGSVPDVGSMADVLGEWVRNTTGTALTHVTLVDMVRVMLATTSSQEALESERAANAMLTDRVEELETMIKVFRGCIETGMMPKPGSPCQRKVFELVGERGDV